MSAPTNAPARLCAQCHAQVILDAPTTCPACGGKLIPTSAPIVENTPPPQIDHRGIVLPPRHAVGGVITPR